jgi:hypothetical protein
MSQVSNRNRRVRLLLGQFNFESTLNQFMSPIFVVSSHLSVKQLEVITRKSCFVLNRLTDATRPDSLSIQMLYQSVLKGRKVSDALQPRSGFADSSSASRLRKIASSKSDLILDKPNQFPLAQPQTRSLSPFAVNAPTIVFLNHF